MAGISRYSRSMGELSRRYWATFSYIGLVVGTLFFAASLTPSLLPRHFAVQGILSGMAFSVGYALGVCFVLLWLFMELPEPSGRLQSVCKWITTVAVTVIVVTFLWWANVWQNSIRQVMEMGPVETAYPWRVAAIAVITAAILVAIARGLRSVWQLTDRKLKKLLPRRVSYVLSLTIIAVTLLLLVNNVLARFALDVADAVFLELDKAIDEGIQPPTDPGGTGSQESLIHWDSLGRQGKRFITTGPTRESIGEFREGDALQPLRVYVGMRTKETIEERAHLALEELLRVGGFDRSVLIVATPTGTGWLDPGGVDTVEYLHGGDTAIVSMQYSYLPSWITILIDPHRSRASAQGLFKLIYEHWKTLPHDDRPKLYLQGLSLGSLGSESSADIFTIFEDPIQGGVWSGPPFPSPVWGRAVRGRNPDTPMWLPQSGNGSMLRFTGRSNSLDLPDARWGPMRFVYIQHASDPMTFFAPSLLFRKPDWLARDPGPDVSPYFRWYPVVTFLQTGFDIPMATSVPVGYGHNISPSSYIHAWVEVTDPPRWTGEETERLKELFRQD